MRENAGSFTAAVLLDRQTGEEFNIRRYSTSLGREVGCDLVINIDRTISRQHALIQYIDGKYHIQDLSSKNGTRLNGKKLETMSPLRSGDEIMIGLTRLVFVLLPQHNFRSPISSMRTETVIEPVAVPLAPVARV
jgi:pSer/pThr/pTyr-binding forkhead associated (FHA) protein